MVDEPVVPPTMISILRSTITSMSSTISTSTSSTWTTETPEFEMEGRIGITEAAAQLAKAKAVKTAGSSMRETRPWRVRDMVVEGRSKEETKEGRMPPGTGETMERVWPCLLYPGLESLGHDPKERCAVFKLRSATKPAYRPAASGSRGHQTSSPQPNMPSYGGVLSNLVRSGIEI